MVAKITRFFAKAQASSSVPKSNEEDDFVETEQSSIMLSRAEQYLHLIELALTGMAIPISTVKCERGFSTQNRIKRNRLKTARLDILMRLSEEGPPVGEMEYDRPAKIWSEAKERRLFTTKKNNYFYIHVIINQLYTTIYYN